MKATPNFNLFNVFNFYATTKNFFLNNFLSKKKKHFRFKFLYFLSKKSNFCKKTIFFDKYNFDFLYRIIDPAPYKFYLQKVFFFFKIYIKNS